MEELFAVQFLISGAYLIEDFFTKEVRCSNEKDPKLMALNSLKLFESKEEILKFLQDKGYEKYSFHVMTIFKDRGATFK